MPASLRGTSSAVLYFVLLCLLFPACLHPQASTDASYQAKRQKAVELFSQGKRLEALPLLEELVKTNPRDDEMLVALAASLVDHAATLTDPAAAGKERFRARDLLDQAWKLGNTSPLGMNLAELLKNLPATGAIKFSDNPQVQQAMEAGEAAFSRRDFDAAIANYSRALQLEPKNYSAALFIGNAYDKKNDFADAAQWYGRAIQIDPNTETAYRYFADMLAREGDMKKARDLLIQAVIAEPYNRIVWRELHAWATLNKTKVNLLYVGIPAPQKELPADSASTQSPAIEQAWKPYFTVKENWKRSEFKEHYPNEPAYRHSVAEEHEALSAVAQALQKLKGEKKSIELDENSELLLRLQEAGMLEPYVLFSLGDAGISRDYATYRAQHRALLEEYLNKFVVPALP